MEKELNINLSEIVRAFIKDQEGRWRKHISDKMLEHLLAVLIKDNHSTTKNQSLDNAAYIVGCTIFEEVLEGRCEAGGNGHHVAQDLGRRFKE